MPDTKEGGGAGRAWPLFVGLPLILAVAIAAVLLSGGGEDTRPTEEGQPPRSAGEQPSGGEPGQALRGSPELGHPALGRADAPVVMIEYGDFQ